MTDSDELEETLAEATAGRANYLLINLVAKRVRALNKGFKPLVEAETGADLAEVVLEELRRGKLKLLRRKKDAAEEEEEPESRAQASEEEE